MIYHPSASVWVLCTVPLFLFIFEHLLFMFEGNRFPVPVSVLRYTFPLCLFQWCLFSASVWVVYILCFCLSGVHSLLLLNGVHSLLLLSGLHSQFLFQWCTVPLFLFSGTLSFYFCFSGAHSLLLFEWCTFPVSMSVVYISSVFVWLVYMPSFCLSGVHSLCFCLSGVHFQFLFQW